MKRSTLLTIACLIAFAAGPVLTTTAEAAGHRLFFLHHSTGRYLLSEGDARATLAAVAAEKALPYALWDHGYNWEGLTGPDGVPDGYDFAVPGDNTDPDGLFALWCTANSARDSILSRFDVIAFKSCYTASDVATPAELQQYKDWYLAIRDELDRHPDKTFLIVSPPPRHRLATTSAQADLARAYARWLGSPEFLAGHPNLQFFDLFDLLAAPDDGSASRNTLRWDYERSHTTADSHPNTAANLAISPLFVNALVKAANRGGLAAAAVPASVRLLGARPNPFNPSTAIRFALERPADVRLDVHDLRGRLVRTLATAHLDAGEHAVRWDGRDGDGRALPSGVYLYRLHAGPVVLGGRMVLAK